MGKECEFLSSCAGEEVGNLARGLSNGRIGDADNCKMVCQKVGRECAICSSVRS